MTKVLAAHQLRVEQKVFWRSREAAVFIFIFPVMLFGLLGSVYHGTIEVAGVKHDAPDVLLAGLLGYGAANTAFAGIAISLVGRREMGILKRLRATPLPLASYLTAVLGSTLVVFLLQTVTIFAIGRALFGTPFPGRSVGSLALALLLAAAAFAAIGLAAAGLIRSADGASAVVNVVLLPMAFLSGSFGPTRDYPSFLRAIGDVLPLKYVLDLVNSVYLNGHAVWAKPGAIAVVAAWGLVGGIVAVRRFGWEPRER